MKVVIAVSLCLFIAGLQFVSAQQPVSRFTVSTTYDPPTLGNGSSAVFSVNVPGAVLGMPAVASFDQIKALRFQLTANVESAGRVSVVLRNTSGSTVNLPTGVLTVSVLTSGSTPTTSPTPSPTATPTPSPTPAPTPPAGDLSGLANLKPGQTLILKAGTYPVQLKDIPSGLPGQPITIKAQSGDQVVFKPGAGTFVLSLNNKSYITLESLVFDGAGTDNATAKLTDGTHHVRLVNCTIRNSPRSHGLLITHGNGTSDSNEIIDCTISDNGNQWVGPVSPPHGIYVSSSNNVIDGCRIYGHTQGWAIHHFSGGVNNVIRNNTIRDNNEGVLSSGDGDQIYNNLFLNHRGYALRVGTGSPLNGALVAYNSFFDDGASISIGDGAGPRGTITNCAVKNNICWSSLASLTGDGSIVIHTDASGTIVTNNLIRKAVLNLGLNTTLLNNIVADPLYSLPSTGDLRLKAGSPAFSMGTAIPEVTIDKDGKARNGSITVGAYQ